MKLPNKNYRVIILLPVMVIAANLSCKKYLEKSPDDRLAVPQSVTDLQAVLDFTNVMNIYTTPGIGEASCDDYYLQESTYSSSIVTWQNLYTWQLGDYFFQNGWSKAYNAIYNANYCLDELKNTPPAPQLQDAWNNVKGSALFYRSYYFMHLLWEFAKAYDPASSNTDPGIVLRLGSDFNVPSKRASVKECYDRVIEDARLCAGYLPDHPVHVMRPSKSAAWGLLAKAYLSMRQYDSALHYATLCLGIDHDLIDYNGDPGINGSLSATVPFVRFNKEVIFYSEMNNNSFINSPTKAKIDTVLYAMYDSNDLRKTAFFRVYSGGYRFKCIYTGNITQYFTGIATDEIYLIKAECEARTGKIPEALEDLNTLLQKRYSNATPYVAFTSDDPAAVLHKILQERRKELLMRGVRWIDIKRLNKENANITLIRNIGGQTYTLLPGASYYALPLPADIIQASGIAQNER